MYFTYLLLGLALVQYQNCAPSAEVLGETAADEQVDVIDPINVGEISFAQGKVNAFLSDSVVVSGICGQSGSMIGWKLTNANGDFIERGLAECDLGSFEVALSDNWKGHCDQDLILKAALGVEAHSEVVVSAFCE